MRTKIKMCGMTCVEDALAAAAAGADAIGFVFASASPRYISPEAVRSIINRLPPLVTTVGVFVDSTVEEIRHVVRASGIHAVQLHGAEPLSFLAELGPFVIRAVRTKPGINIEQKVSEWECVILIDGWSSTSHGGSGYAADWDAAGKVAAKRPILLAGGLTPQNVSDAIHLVRPYAVDVASGIEDAPGVKNHARIREFVKAVHDADQELQTGEPY